MDKKNEVEIRPAGSFSIEERRLIVQEFLSGKLRKVEIWFKYTGSREEHGNLNRWMVQLGMKPDGKTTFRFGKKNTILVTQSDIPVEKHKKEESPEDLKKRIKDLEQQLETARLKVEGYEIMIDLAEKELNIPIRKKSNTK